MGLGELAGVGGLDRPVGRGRMARLRRGARQGLGKNVAGALPAGEAESAARDRGRPAGTPVA
jgi:hypothetical protein